MEPTIALSVAVATVITVILDLSPNCHKNKINKLTTLVVYKVIHNTIYYNEVIYLETV